jgi:DNA invertase Pin-like site-specific DNA recombinase
VVVTKLDRFGRSLEHLIELSHLLPTRDVALVVLDQGIDTSTPCFCASLCARHRNGL